uniref:FAD/NAD(P)-binding domain-containing protein n=1 Tax=Chromera velia CCMP2878 TaxID=1169474 RepID=A0A0G4HN80_9ALVE|eukprot:Cvel_7612.t1-p1 / transcript=Cvel_7612.t1 / gene=Cvel_7612 / organism=Chromera_velia_CCMP2878 / gene_product=hypothetical protein / transcript_product=hypothetical protein / location=Cvel_scaffold401:68054-74705(-) / protein_length=1680 / sequence_SO=supercontig / SO=protein_coding / is_pseudo=false
MASAAMFCLLICLAAYGCAKSFGVLRSLSHPSPAFLPEFTVKFCGVMQARRHRKSEGKGPAASFVRLALGHANASDDERNCGKKEDGDGIFRICVIGGGIGGLATALLLEKLVWSRKRAITLVDASRHFTFKPRLVDLAVDAVRQGEVSVPYEEIPALQETGIERVQGRVRSVGLENMEVEMDICVSRGVSKEKEDVERVRWEYDCVVLSPGVEVPAEVDEVENVVRFVCDEERDSMTPGTPRGKSDLVQVPGVIEFGDFRSAMELRKFLRAALQEEGGEAGKRVAVVGGGALGVELALNICAARHRRQSAEQNNESESLEVHLFCGSDRVLPRHSTPVRRSVESLLKERGVKVHRSSQVAVDGLHRGEGGALFLCADRRQREEIEATLSTGVPLPLSWFVPNSSASSSHSFSSSLSPQSDCASVPPSSECEAAGSVRREEFDLVVIASGRKAKWNQLRRRLQRTQRLREGKAAVRAVDLEVAPPPWEADATLAASSKGRLGPWGGSGYLQTDDRLRILRQPPSGGLSSPSCEGQGSSRRTLTQPPGLLSPKPLSSVYKGAYALGDIAEVLHSPVKQQPFLSSVSEDQGGFDPTGSAQAALQQALVVAWNVWADAHEAEGGGSGEPPGSSNERLGRSGFGENLSRFPASDLSDPQSKPRFQWRPVAQGEVLSTDAGSGEAAVCVYPPLASFLGPIMAVIHPGLSPTGTVQGEGMILPSESDELGKAGGKDGGKASERGGHRDWLNDVREVLGLVEGDMGLLFEGKEGGKLRDGVYAWRDPRGERDVLRQSAGFLKVLQALRGKSSRVRLPAKTAAGPPPLSLRELKQWSDTAVDVLLELLSSCKNPPLPLPPLPPCLGPLSGFFPGNPGEAAAGFLKGPPEGPGGAPAGALFDVFARSLIPQGGQKKSASGPAGGPPTFNGLVPLLETAVGRLLDGVPSSRDALPGAGSLSSTQLELMGRILSGEGELLSVVAPDHEEKEKEKHTEIQAAEQIWKGYAAVLGEECENLHPSEKGGEGGKGAAVEEVGSDCAVRERLPPHIHGERAKAQGGEASCERVREKEKRGRATLCQGNRGGTVVQGGDVNNIAELAEEQSVPGPEVENGIINEDEGAGCERTDTHHNFVADEGQGVGRESSAGDLIGEQTGSGRKGLEPPHGLISARDRKGVVREDGRGDDRAGGGIFLPSPTAFLPQSPHELWSLLSRGSDSPFPFPLPLSAIASTVIEAGADWLSGGGGGSLLSPLVKTDSASSSAGEERGGLLADSLSNHPFSSSPPVRSMGPAWGGILERSERGPLRTDSNQIPHPSQRARTDGEGERGRTEDVSSKGGTAAVAVAAAVSDQDPRGDVSVERFCLNDTPGLDVDRPLMKNQTAEIPRGRRKTGSDGERSMLTMNKSQNPSSDFVSGWGDQKSVSVSLSSPSPPLLSSLEESELSPRDHPSHSRPTLPPPPFSPSLDAPPSGRVAGPQKRKRERFYDQAETLGVFLGVGTRTDREAEEEGGRGQTQTGWGLSVSSEERGDGCNLKDPAQARVGGETQSRLVPGTFATGSGWPAFAERPSEARLPETRGLQSAKETSEKRMATGREKLEESQIQSGPSSETEISERNEALPSGSPMVGGKRGASSSSGSGVSASVSANRRMFCQVAVGVPWKEAVERRRKRSQFHGAVNRAHEQDCRRDSLETG